jgi:hypothetical protein
MGVICALLSLFLRTEDKNQGKRKDRQTHMQNYFCVTVGTSGKYHGHVHLWLYLRFRLQSLDLTQTSVTYGVPQAVSECKWTTWLWPGALAMAKAVTLLTRFIEISSSNFAWNIEYHDLSSSWLFSFPLMRRQSSHIEVGHDRWIHTLSYHELLNIVTFDAIVCELLTASLNNHHLDKIYLRSLALTKNFNLTNGIDHRAIIIYFIAFI